MAEEKSKIALTESKIEGLKATGKTYYVNDAKTPALSVRVSAGGVKALIFTKFKYGRLIRITLGRVGALRLDAARLAAQKLHGDIASGIDIAAARKAMVKGRGETMQQAYEKFLKLKTRRPSSVASYEQLWRLNVPAGLKNKPVKEVDAGDLRGIMRNLEDKKRTANKVITLIAAIMAKSGRWADNPAREVVKHPEHVRTRRLSIEELSSVWRAIEGEKEWGDFFRLLILTGARRGAFCTMKWRDLDLDAGVWLVPVEWSKSKRELAVPLAEEAVRILKARKLINCEQLGASTKSEWVWRSRESRTGHVVNPEIPWKRILKAAGVGEHKSLHDIRRTLGSRLAMGPEF
jgi:integrase